MVRVLLVVALVLVACGKHERRAFTTWSNAAEVLKSQICADAPFFIEPEPFHIAGIRCRLRAAYAESPTVCFVSILIGASLATVTYVSVQCVGLKTPVYARLLADLARGMQIDIPPSELLALTAEPDPALELTLVWQRSDVQLQFERTWNPDLNVGDAIARLALVQQRETINRREPGPDRFGEVSAKYLELYGNPVDATPTW